MKNFEVRAWDIDKGEYIYCPSSIGSDIGECITFKGLVFHEGKIKNYIIEQYTGFNDDSNERIKIFEGDIIKCIYEYDMVTGKVYKEENEYKVKTGIVVWHEDKGSWFLWGYGTLGCNLEDAQQVEVMGNRHNKELYNAVYNDGLEYE
jgi:uncharacterized phage protein (TIGR01671 family)